jgi:PBP1b-binding outer membrane lipoprotein LpoB
MKTPITMILLAVILILSGCAADTSVDQGQNAAQIDPTAPAEQVPAQPVI